MHLLIRRTVALLSFLVVGLNLCANDTTFPTSAPVNESISESATATFYEQPELFLPELPELHWSAVSRPLPYTESVSLNEPSIPPSPTFDHADLSESPHSQNVLPRFVNQYGSVPSSASAFQANSQLPPPQHVRQQAVQGTYWVVSSRESVQNIHQSQRGRWGLDVFQRLPNGQLVRGDVPSLVSQLNPNLPVCIFAHGSFVEWESQLQQAHEFYNLVAPNCGGQLQIIFYTWLSDGPRTHVLPVDVAVRGRRADFNSFHMSSLVASIPESCPITFIGHSHGTRLILATMHLVGGGTVEGYRYPYAIGTNRRFRAILAAGAFEHDWLNPGQPYECALRKLECLLNLQNRKDAALALFPLSRPFSARAVARSGFTNRDFRSLGSATYKIQEVDVSELVGMRHYWPNYYQQPAVINAILPYLWY